MFTMIHLSVLQFKRAKPRLLQAETDALFKMSSSSLNRNVTSLDPTWRQTHSGSHNTGLSEGLVEHVVGTSLCETPH